MLQVARLAPGQLLEAGDSVRDFISGQVASDGGFRDRAGSSDLYYTVFGIECLIALRAELPSDRLIPYVRSFGDGAGLDLVHLGCLARCDAALERTALSDADRAGIARRFGDFRSADGAYHNTPGRELGTIYGCFVATGGLQDLGLELPDPDGVSSFLEAMATPDGGFANERSMKFGTTPATCAAVTLLRQLRRPIPERAGDWLFERWNPDGGGFFAAPGAPMPDLLSTATTLHALSGLERRFDALREPCLDFVDTLWTSEGSFFGHWAEQTLDCEYTFYGLLALGHLSI